LKRHDRPPNSEGTRSSRRSIQRLLTGIGVGVLVGLVVSMRARWMVAVVAGWDASAFALLLWSWIVIWTSNPTRTKVRAGADDPGRTLVWLLVSLASAFGLFAATVVLRDAKGSHEDVLVALSLTAVVEAWLLTHTSFTHRYARLYYRPQDGVGGLCFPGNEAPDDFDFAYFAFTIGMCFQVSDVTITGRSLRRTSLIHACLAFAYNTAIVALALNVFFNLLG
jgi:uncharacterized membrane protein